MREGGLAASWIVHRKSGAGFHLGVGCSQLKPSVRSCLRSNRTESRCPEREHSSCVRGVVDGLQAQGTVGCKVVWHLAPYGSMTAPCPFDGEGFVRV